MSHLGSLRFVPDAPKPETSNFESTANAILARYRAPGGLNGLTSDALHRAIVEALRQVWNARGAADIAKIDTELSETSASVYVKSLDRTLRGLDR